MTALLLTGLLAIGHGQTAPHHHQSQRLRNCPKTFTLAMDHRGADVIYHHHGPITASDRAQLRRLSRCQRRSRDVRPARRYNLAQRRARAQREFLNPPVELSSLARCIMWAETGDRFYIAVGEYEGVAMWDPDAWRLDDGYRYASSPLGATPRQQEATLMWALDRGMAWEWTADPCV